MMGQRKNFKLKVLYTVLMGSLASFSAANAAILDDHGVINSNRTYSEDTTINFNGGTFATVNADFGDVSIEGQNNSSLTLNATKDERGQLLRAKDGHTLSFARFKDLSITTNNYVLNAVQGTISANVAGNLKLNSTAATGYLISTATRPEFDEKSLVSLAANNIDLSSQNGVSAIHAVDASGKILLTAKDTITIDVAGGHGIYNQTGTEVDLSAGNAINIKTNDHAIFAKEGVVNLNAGSSLDMEGPGRLVVLEGNAAVNLGNENQRIASIHLTSDKSSVSAGEDQTDTSFNIFAGTTTIHSKSESTFNFYGNINLRSTTLDVASDNNHAMALRGKENQIYSDKLILRSALAPLLLTNAGKTTISGDSAGSVDTLAVVSGSGYGIQAKEQSAIKISSVNTDIRSEEQIDLNDDQPFEGNAINATQNSSIVFLDTGRADQKITVDSRWGSIFSSYGGYVEVQSGAVDLVGSVLATTDAKVLLGTKNALSSANFYVEDGNTGADLAAVNARNGTIEINAVEASIKSSEYAVLATAQQVEGAVPTTSSVSIEASKMLRIDGNISANLHHDEEATAEAKGSRSVIINQKQSGTVVLNGNITTQSSQTAHSEVTIGFKTADSVLNGAVEDMYVGAEPSGSEGGTSLAFEDGASWNVQGDSKVKSVTADDGTIHTNGHNMALGKLVNTDQGAKFVTNSGRARQITVDEYTGNFAVNITEEGMNEIDAGNAAQSMASIIDATAAQGSDGTISMHGAESVVLGETELTLDAQGNITSYSEAPNTISESLQDIAGMNFLFFRASMNDVSKRMGDLRTMPKSAGV